MKYCLVAGLLALLPLAAFAQSDVEKIQNANWFEREVAAGATWRYYHFDNLFNSQQDVHVASVDMSVAGNTVKINYRAGGTRVPITSFVGDYANTAFVVNGNFINLSNGIPLQHVRIDGIVRYVSVVDAHDEGGVVVDAAGDADTVLRPTTAGKWNDRTEPDVMASNVPLWDEGVRYSLPLGQAFYNVDRHPRTAVGKTPDGRFLFVIVDGRRSGAAGMTLVELQTLFEGLGASDGLNMDGGGSSAMWARNEPGNGIVNVPSDGSVRSVTDGLSIIAPGAATPVEWDARLTSLVVSPLTRSGEAYPVVATYANIGTQTWTPSTVGIVPSRAFGRASGFVPAGQETTFAVMEPASVAPGGTATFILNLVPPTVATDTLFTETFALWHSTEGWFGPADNALGFSVTVRPPLTGAPPAFIVQGTPTGINNQWYTENTAAGGWSNSTIQFTAPGVNNSGAQRYCGASVAGRSAAFRPIFEVAGTYSVEVAYSYSSNNIASVQCTVSHLNGTDTFTQNQNTQSNANGWRMLGQFDFGTGSSDGLLGDHSITVGNGATTGNRFYSGAVRLDYIGPLPTGENWEVN